MKFPAIFLASRSPRRAELLRQMGVHFAVLNAAVDETPLLAEQPLAYVQRVACDKALAGYQFMRQQADHRPVLAADTAVVVGQQIYGKPQDVEQARWMLQQLSGRTHQVITAVALVDLTGKIHSRHCCSDVSVTRLSDADIDWYLATTEGQDKAGGYAVQGLAALFIEKISGSYSGIMGLPIYETGQLLNAITMGMPE